MASPDTLANIGVVRVANNAPVVGVDGDVWYNPATGALSVSHNGAWMPAGGGGGGVAALPEVMVSATAPVAPNVLVWIDNSGPTVAVKYRIAAGWRTGLDAGRF